MSWLLHPPKQHYHFYGEWLYTSIYHQQRAWHLLWICMSLWQLKAGKHWQWQKTEELWAIQCCRDVIPLPHTTPLHSTQLLYWFCNSPLFSPSSLSNPFPLAFLLDLCTHLFCSTLTFQPDTYSSIWKVKLLLNTEIKSESLQRPGFKVAQDF